MDLKNALAVCLISLFSATLVVLIARSLDNQAASRIEPQLAQIVEELRSLRGQGGIAGSPGASGPVETVRDGLIAYYFHSNTRCPTCRSIESQAKETVETRFAPELRDGKLVWKMLNYEQDAVKPLATQFEIMQPVVVLAKMKNGQVEKWKRLDEVWALVGDKPAYTKYVAGQIEKMLPQGESPSSQTAETPEESTPPANPAPAVETELPLDAPSGALPE